MSSYELDLAKALEASQTEFAILAKSIQKQSLEMSMSPSRHFSLPFRREREFSQEVADQQKEQLQSFGSSQTNIHNERRLREMAMFNYIATNTNYLSEEPEQRE